MSRIKKIKLKAPSTGPGEGPASTEALPFSEADFLPGGDIYESFVANLTKIKGRRAQQEPVTVVQPAQGHDALSKYFKGVRPTLSEELAALASIKITRDRCHGLRKAKSEERPMTCACVLGHSSRGLRNFLFAGDCCLWTATTNREAATTTPFSLT